MAIIVAPLLILALVGLAVAESALNAISKSRAEALEEDDVPGAAELVEDLEDRRRLIAPILALSLSAQLALGAIVALFVARNFAPAWIPVALVLLLCIMLVVTESVPKTWAQRNMTGQPLKQQPLAARFAPFPQFAGSSAVSAASARSSSAARPARPPK